MSLLDFQAAVRPKYDGTKNLSESLANDALDFFVMLSSLSGVLGTAAQCNYAAGNVFLDEFAHYQKSQGKTNFVSLDISLIRESGYMSDSILAFVLRQGATALSTDSLLPLVDYAMGRAGEDGNNQIILGLSPQSLLVRAKNNIKIPPLLGHIYARSQQSPVATQGHDIPHRRLGEAVAQAASAAEAGDVILSAIKTKVSTLIAVEPQDLDLHIPVIELGLDSLVSIELKNWVINGLRSDVETSDIMDSPSLEAFADLVLARSGLVTMAKAGESGPEVKATTESLVGSGAIAQVCKDQDSRADSKASCTTGSSPSDDGVVLPKLPLPLLEATLTSFLESVAHLGTDDDCKRIQDSVAEMTASGGMGRKLQGRLQELHDDPTVHNRYINSKNNEPIARKRNLGPREDNWFAVIPGSDTPRPQAERAAVISLAALNYKLSLSDGTAKRDYLNEMPLCMETVQWLFNSSRVPVLGHDRVDRWPGNDYVAAMRRGRVYRVPLLDSEGRTITHSELELVFQAILQHAPGEAHCWAPIFTTDERDEWARNRDAVLAANRVNEEYISTIEKSLFLVCLDESAPTTSSERATALLFDDNSNRWVDKSLSFVVCANGVSAFFCHHALVDGTTVTSPMKAIARAIFGHDPSSTASTPTTTDLRQRSFTHLPFASNPTLDKIMTHLRTQHLGTISDYSYRRYDYTHYGACYLRSHKLPAKAVFQVVLQVAARRYFGYSPVVTEANNQRHFQSGRADGINTNTAEVVAFCAAAGDSTIFVEEKKRKLIAAVRSHAKLVALAMRGCGWRRHIGALILAIRAGDEVPRFFSDPLLQQVMSDNMLFTNFPDPPALLDAGSCWSNRKGIWTNCVVDDER